MKLYFYWYDNASNTVEITADDYEEVFIGKEKRYINKTDGLISVSHNDLGTIHIDYCHAYIYTRQCHGESITAHCYSSDLNIDKFIKELSKLYMSIANNMASASKCIAEGYVHVRRNYED